MIRFMVLIFVIQICYCSASCTCTSDYYPLPIYGACLIGLTIFILFFTAVALAVIVYRLKSVNSNGSLIFGGDRNVSISKYERQLSGNSQRPFVRNSVNDDTIELNLNENKNNRDDTDASQVYVEMGSRSNIAPKNIRKQPKVSIFPQMKKEQMDALCAAVLSKHRMKESTSLSDLDKIINDANQEEIEKSKSSDISASTPVLDVYDVLPSPLPIKNQSFFGTNSNELKLQEEIKAKFNKDKIKSKVNEKEIKLKVKEDEIESNVSKDEINSKVKEIKSEGNQEKNRSKLNPDECKSKSKDTAEPVDNRVVQDEIYDCPPPPTAVNELYDFPPSHRPPSELYDIPPSSGTHNEMYECPPSPRSRNIIVSDDDCTGYLFPITDHNGALIDVPQYTNAKSMTDLNSSLGA